MKKVLSLLALVLLCCFVLVGCEMLCSNGIVEHAYESVVTDATCTEDGYTTHTCKYCGDSYTDSFIESSGHIAGEYVAENVIEPDCTSKGSCDKVVYCSICNTELSRKYSVIDALGHSFAKTVTEPTDTTYGYTDFVCLCGYEYQGAYMPELVHSEGLEMVLDSSWGYRIVGMGTCTDTEIIIPSCYNGDIVYAIDEGAFEGRTDITGVKLPAFLYTIKSDAFRNCTSLEYVVVQGCLEEVWHGAFKDCTSLKSVYVTDIMGWYESKFYNISANPLFNNADLYFDGELVTELVVPEEVSVVKSCLFYGCASLKSVKIHGGITEIESSAFGACQNIESVEIDLGVSYIDDYVFAYSPKLVSIKFGGTIEECMDVFDWCYVFTGVPADVIQCTDGDLPLDPYYR